MKILCDENLPIRLAARLRDDGHDAQDVREIGFAGAHDDAVLAHALNDARVVVTEDRKRFGNILLTPSAGTAGFVVVRLPELSPSAKVERIRAFFATVDAAFVAGALIILEPAQVRRRT